MNERRAHINVFRVAVSTAAATAAVRVSVGAVQLPAHTELMLRGNLCVYHKFVYMHLHYIDHNRQEWGDEHYFGVHLKVLRDASTDGEVHQNAGHYPDHQHRGEGANDLRSVPAKRHST